MAHEHDEISRVLTSALLVDVDFSRWDQIIRFVVCVDQNEEFGPGSDLYNLDCQDVSSFSWNAEAAMQVERRPGIQTRVQLWRTLISERDRDLRLELRTSGPTILLDCKAVQLSVSDTKLASIVDPEWFMPGHPFARGSLEGIAARLTNPEARARRGKKG